MKCFFDENEARGLCRFCGFDDRNRVADEPVTTTGHSLEKPRLRGVVAQSLAEFGDGHAQVTVELDESPGSPQMVPQLIARDNLSGVLHEKQQHAQGKFLDPDARPLVEQKSGLDAQLERAKAIAVSGLP